jgi:hypothetical protein
LLETFQVFCSGRVYLQLSVFGFEGVDTLLLSPVASLLRTWYYWQAMSNTEKVVKFTISMDRDLRDWVDEKVEELNRKDRRLKTSRSAIIADAVEQMRQHKAAGHSFSTLVNPKL